MRDVARDERGVDWRGALIASAIVAAIASLFALIAPAFFWKDDFQLQYLPASRDVIRAWSEGSLPLLSPYSWFCTALAGEYQFGVFSVDRLATEALVWLIPVSLTARAALLVVFHLALTAAGAYLLARSYGVRRAYALMVAVAASLNGYQLWWGTTWYPAIASFAWLPWFWLGLRSASRSWIRCIPAGLALYLIVTAGWPFGVAMAMLVAATVVAQTLVARQWRAAARIVFSVCTGLLIAAPAVLMLLEYFKTSARMTITTRLETIWTIPLRSLVAFALPTFTSEWPVFAGMRLHMGVELAGSLAALAAIVALVVHVHRSFIREHALELVLLAATIVLLLVPGVGVFRWSFRWLPLTHLVIALCGARALERMRARHSAFASLALLVVAAVVAVVLDENRAQTMMLAALLAGVIAIWAWSDSDWGPLTLTAVTIAAVFLLFRPVPEVPAWRVDARALPRLEYAPRFLSLYTIDDVIGGEDGRMNRAHNPELMPGNLAMLLPLVVVNGYSPIGPAALKNMFRMDAHGAVGPGVIEHVIARELGPQGLLQHMGVDGLVIPQRVFERFRTALSSSGWISSGTCSEAVFVHRQTPVSRVAWSTPVALEMPRYENVFAYIWQRRSDDLPVVMWAPVEKPRAVRYATRALSDIRETRNATEVTVAPSSGSQPSLVVFSRPWAPGFKAFIDGKPVPVVRADLIMPAVVLTPAQSGRLVLVYRPGSLIAGSLLAAIALVTLVGGSIVLGRRESPPDT